MQDNMDAIYREHAQTVYKFLLYLTKDQPLAEELTQETFYRAVKNIGQFNGTCKISAWLCQIAKYTWYQYLEKEKKYTRTELPETLPNPTNLEDSYLLLLDQIDLLKQMQTLPQLTREVLYLRLMANLSFADIGEVLGKTETWARVTFYRGKQKLKEGGLQNE